MVGMKNTGNELKQIKATMAEDVQELFIDNGYKDFSECSDLSDSKD